MYVLCMCMYAYVCVCMLEYIYVMLAQDLRKHTPCPSVRGFLGCEMEIEKSMLVSDRYCIINL